MKKERPLILISNDDGVWAKGINELVRFIRHLGEIVVVAPDSPRSGSGCALTVVSPVTYRMVSREEGVTIYQCSGTPTDCVKLALHTILDRKPDLVIGGINHGDNSAVNVHYSGTMGIVIEGCLRAIPSIGFSLCDHQADADFQPAASFISQITEKVLTGALPSGVCLNVNIPVVPAYKGIKATTQAKGYWDCEWEPCPRSNGDPCFWLTGCFVEREPDTDTTDYRALQEGYITVTPITVDLTAYGFMDQLQKMLS
ncbi:MAG: 5'/3'-nucleotidase SurE [Bacteroides sp.]|nr:5'/3'-nucleotidase SurE [Bacteroides sp.]